MTNYIVSAGSDHIVHIQTVIPSGWAWVFGLMNDHRFTSALVIIMGSLRPFLHSFNEWVSGWVKKNMTGADYKNIFGIGGWRAFDFIIHLLFSISPSVLNAAIQLVKIGDSDTKIAVPSIGGIHTDQPISGRPIIPSDHPGGVPPQG